MIINEWHSVNYPFYINKLTSAAVMESKIAQLKKDFKSQIIAIDPKEKERSTTSILTEEEMTELQNAWIQLAIWKQGKTNS